MKNTGTVLICLFFAVLFGIGGAAGIGNLFQYVNGWFETRNWEPVMVEIVATNLEPSRGRRVTTHRVTAEYRYTAGGKNFTATRVGLHDTFDNVGGWNEEQHARFREAMRTGQRIAAWADPARPEKAILDREMRWSMISFMLPFAILFPMISLGALWMMFRSLDPSPERGKKPAKPKGNAAESRSRKKRR